MVVSSVIAGRRGERTCDVVAQAKTRTDPDAKWAFDGVAEPDAGGPCRALARLLGRCRGLEDGVFVQLQQASCSRPAVYRHVGRPNVRVFTNAAVGLGE